MMFNRKIIFIKFTLSNSTYRLGFSETVLAKLSVGKGFIRLWLSFSYCLKKEFDWVFIII